MHSGSHCMGGMVAGNEAGKSQGLDVTKVVPEQVNSLVHGKQPYTTSG